MRKRKRERERERERAGQIMRKRHRNRTKKKKEREKEFYKNRELAQMVYSFVHIIHKFTLLNKYICIIAC